MNEAHGYGTKQIYPQLHNVQLFRLSRIKEIEDFFIAYIIERDEISKALSKYITTLDYAVKTYFVMCTRRHFYLPICYCHWCTY